MHATPSRESEGCASVGDTVREQPSTFAAQRLEDGSYNVTCGPEGVSFDITLLSPQRLAVMAGSPIHVEYVPGATTGLVMRLSVDGVVLVTVNAGAKTFAGGDDGG